MQRMIIIANQENTPDKNFIVRPASQYHSQIASQELEKKLDLLGECNKTSSNWKSTDTIAKANLFHSIAADL